MKEKLKNEDKEIQIEMAIEGEGEDSTKYGEFISTYFAWVPLQEQKEKVEKLENITKKDKKKRKN